MTPGPARGKKSKYGIRAPKAAILFFVSPPSGLLALTYPLPPVAPGVIIVMILRI